ncbi:MAG: ABC transporter permease, partial [Bacteroidales bacterium]|nr:ABC transporter permease [Bacteroidales bacterium]
WLVRNGDVRFNEDGVLFADSSFFRVFSFRLLRGDRNKALVNPRSIVLTEEFAAKYFGKEDPIGKKISLEADTNLYTVTGVVENVPSNSHMQFDMLGSLNSLRNSQGTNWVNHNFHTYVRLREGSAEEDMEPKLQGCIEKYVGPQIKEFLGITIEDFRNAGNQFGYELEPLSDIHLKGAPQYSLEPAGSVTNVIIFAVIALLILIVAIINYVNLATARSASRAKEVGIRKVSGGDKAGLMAQFIGESLLLVTVAAFIASMLVLVLMPLFNNLIGKDISLSLAGGARGVIGLGGLIAFTGILAGFYPAFVLASYNPAEVLKGTLNPGSMSKTLRGILVVFQFSVSIIIIIGAFAVYRQLNFMTSADLGFDKEKLLVVRRPDALERQLESFKDQVLRIPGVENVANATAIPGTVFSNNAFLRDDDPTKATYLINQTLVSIGFAETLGTRLVSGRSFSREYGTDSTAIMINEAAVKALGLKEPVVGQYILQPQRPGEFQKKKIIGVMKDFNIESLHKKITPVCFTIMNGNFEGYLCIRLNGADTENTIRAIEKVWSSISVRQPFQYNFFGDQFNELYETEIKAGRIFVFFAVLAVMIACLGLIGLITYMTTVRTREVGIRKTYGATENSVVSLLSREVLVLIAVSSLLAYPVAWYGISVWLRGFAEKTTINPLIYIAATFIAVITGWLSISWQAIRAAGYNPAEALRYK